MLESGILATIDGRRTYVRFESNASDDSRDDVSTERAMERAAERAEFGAMFQTIADQRKTFRQLE